MVVVLAMLAGIFSGCVLPVSNPFVGTWSNSMSVDGDYYTFNEDATFVNDWFYDVWQHDTGTYEYDDLTLTLSYDNYFENQIVFNYVVTNDTLILTYIIPMILIRAELPAFVNPDPTPEPEPEFVYTDFVEIVYIALDTDASGYDVIQFKFKNVSDQTVIGLKLWATINDVFGDSVAMFGGNNIFSYTGDILSGETTSMLEASLMFDNPYIIEAYGIHEIVFEDGTTWEDLNY